MKLNEFIGFKCSQELKEYFDENGGSEFARTVLAKHMQQHKQPELASISNNKPIVEVDSQTVEKLVLQYLEKHASKFTAMHEEVRQPDKKAGDKQRALKAIKAMLNDDE